MFLSSHLNLNSSPVGGWGLETGNGSVSLFMLNNKKLNCLKSASQGEFFFFFSEFGDEYKHEILLFLSPIGLGPEKAPLEYWGELGHGAWHATSMEFRSLLPTTKLPALLLGKKTAWGGRGGREWVEY